MICLQHVVIPCVLDDVGAYLRFHLPTSIIRIGRPLIQHIQSPRLSSEAQALNEPENLGMAPAARLVVVDVERASEPGVYKVRQPPQVKSWQGETSNVEGYEFIF